MKAFSRIEHRPTLNGRTKLIGGNDVASHTEFEMVIGQAVGGLFRKYRRYGVEREDIEQEILLWWYQESTQKMLESGKPEHYISRAAWYEGKKYCEKERKHALGPDYFRQLDYQAGEVRALLPTALDDEGLILAGAVDGEGGGKSNSLASERGTNMAKVMDVRWAFDQLSEDQQVSVRAVVDGWADEFATLHGIQADSVSRNFNRVTARMAELLSSDRGNG